MGGDSNPKKVELVEVKTEAGDKRRVSYSRESVSLSHEVRPDLISYQTLTYRQTGTRGNDNTLNRPTIGALLYGKNRPGPKLIMPRAKTDLDRFRGAPGESDEESSDESSDDEESEQEEEPKDGTLDTEDEVDYEAMRRFGMWDGVFARCLLQIFGVIMFLRLGWVIGRAGTALATLVMVVSVLITTITTLSLSAICTNGEVQGGGAYFMISRALGPEFGGSIGILFGVANAVGVALYILGFAETIVAQTGSWHLAGDGSWDLQIWGIITLVLVLLLCLNGVGWVIKVQLALLVLLVGSILTVIIGIAMKDPTEKMCFSGLNDETFADNWTPSYTKNVDPCPALADVLKPDNEDESFWSVLSIFFPAVTGIMAGANISGEIKNAEYAIPWGTLLAIFVSTIVYILLGWLMAGSLELEALVTDSIIMTRVSAWGPLVFAGIYAATLSSAIASLVGAPRIFQAVAKDNLFKIMKPLERGFGKNNEPLAGYIFTFIIAFVCILPGNLNVVAPIITSFFILSYAMINYACFLGSYTKSPGWRPSFKYYNKWLSLVGFFICMALMFVLDFISAIVSVFLGLSIYKYLEINRPNVNWGSAPTAGKYYAALKSLRALDTVENHIKTYRPQVLVLAGGPGERLYLVQFIAKYFRKGRGFLSVGGVIIDDLGDLESETITESLKEWQKRRSTKIMNGRKVLGFSDTVVATSLRKGVRALLQVCGLSQMRPNIVALGFKNDWHKCEKQETDDYVNIIRDSFLLQCGVMIFRGIEKFEGNSKEQPAGNIDIWWLSDDGGLTLLLPYLMTLTKTWAKSQIRVMSVSTSAKLSAEQVMMNQLLKKFRIKAEVVPIDLEVNNRGQLDDPSEKTMEEYDSFFPDAENSENLSKRTKRHLLVSEVIKQHSSKASCVFISIPVPEIKLDSYDYLSWLDCLSSELPPTILVRGNQENVLTWEM